MTEVTPEGLRAARAILKWTMRDVAMEAQLALSTVMQIESGSRKPQAATSEKLVETFAQHGVEVLYHPNPGARLLNDAG